MTRANRLLAAALLTLTLTLAGGCTTFEPVDVESSLRDMGGIRPGDEVRVITTEGKERQFEVTAVMPARIEGRLYQFDAWEIESIARREFHVWRTVGAAGALAGGAVAAAGAGSGWFVITAF